MTLPLEAAATATWFNYSSLSFLLGGLHLPPKVAKRCNSKRAWLGFVPPKLRTKPWASLLPCAPGQH